MYLVFIYQYVTYSYHARSSKVYHQMWKDLDRHARPIALTFLMFLTMTFIICWHIFDSFFECFMRGSVVVVLLGPLVNQHYSDT